MDAWTDGGDSSDDDDALIIEQPGNEGRAQSSKAGAYPRPLEDSMFAVLHDLVDNAHGILLERELQSTGRTVQQLQSHIDTIFNGNTEEGFRMKFADWIKYCEAVHGGRHPHVSEINWPPTCDEWEHFLLVTRPKVSSYKRFLGVIGNVVEVANRY